MTGKSDTSPRCMKYYKKLTGGVMIIAGGFLLMEHLFNFGGFDIELLGHEYYGIVLIAAGFMLNIKYKQIPAFLKAIKDKKWHAVIDEGERD